MANLENRIGKLEQIMGQVGESPDSLVCFVRAPDRFCTGYLRPKTGEQVTQGDGESDADFVVRAKAAGFEHSA